MFGAPRTQAPLFGAPAAGQPSPPSSAEQQNRRVQLFWNILYGVQHESVYARERAELRQLRAEFAVADADKQVGGRARPQLYSTHTQTGRLGRARGVIDRRTGRARGVGIGLPYRLSVA